MDVLHNIVVSDQIVSNIIISKKFWNYQFINAIYLFLFSSASSRAFCFGPSPLTAKRFISFSASSLVVLAVSTATFLWCSSFSVFALNPTSDS